MGETKEEYDNLKQLSKKYPGLVINPINYFQNKYREAYLTPYIYQARCIASDPQGYGAYVPDPYYHFDNFSDDDTYEICKVMIANLIRLYDTELNLAIAQCKIGGGDFILEKEYDNDIHNEQNTLKRMHLIAARKLINIELKEYIKLIKKEFSQKTYYKNQDQRDPNIIINLKNRFPMSRDAIEDGIKLGLKLQEISGHIDISI